MYISKATSLKGAKEGVQAGTGVLAKLFGRKTIVADLENAPLVLVNHARLNATTNGFTLSDDSLGGRVAIFQLEGTSAIRVTLPTFPPADAVKQLARSVAFNVAQVLGATLWENGSGHALTERECRFGPSTQTTAQTIHPTTEFSVDLPPLLKAFLQNSNTSIGYLRMHGLVPCSPDDLTVFESDTLEYLCGDVLNITVFARRPILDDNGWWALWTTDDGSKLVIQIEPEGLVELMAPTLSALLSVLLVANNIDEPNTTPDIAGFEDNARRDGIFHSEWRTQRTALQAWAASQDIHPSQDPAETLHIAPTVTEAFDELLDLLPAG